MFYVCVCACVHMFCVFLTCLPDWLSAKFSLSYQIFAPLSETCVIDPIIWINWMRLYLYSKFTVNQYESKVLFLFSNFIPGLWQLLCEISPQIDWMCHFLFKNTLWIYIQGQIFYLYPVGQWAVYWGPLMSCWFSCPQCVSCSCLVVVLDGFFFKLRGNKNRFF